MAASDRADKVYSQNIAAAEAVGSPLAGEKSLCDDREVYIGGRDGNWCSLIQPFPGSISPDDVDSAYLYLGCTNIVARLQRSIVTILVIT